MNSIANYSSYCDKIIHTIDMFLFFITMYRMRKKWTGNLDISKNISFIKNISNKSYRILNNALHGNVSVILNSLLRSFPQGLWASIDVHNTGVANPRCLSYSHRHLRSCGACLCSLCGDRGPWFNRLGKPPRMVQCKLWINS